MFAYLQLERITDGEIDVNDAVVFDNVLSSDGTAISYNMTTGELAFNEAGFYAINWFVAPQFGLTTDGSNFAILSDGGYALTGSSHVKVSPTVGFAVIEVTTPGKRISLINISDNSLTLSQVVNTKAALVAFGPEGAAPDLPYTDHTLETLQNPISASDAFDDIFRKRANRFTEPINDLIERLENLITESSFAYLFPYLFDWIHLRRSGRQENQTDIFRDDERFRPMPCRSVTG